MTNFNPIQKWFWPGRYVRHNFDLGVFRVLEVNFDKETINVQPVCTSQMSIPAPIEYFISCCRPEGLQ